MKNVKQITHEEALILLTEIGHVASITIPVMDNHTREEEYKAVLRNAIVYNPYHGVQRGMGSNESNAERAMRYIKKRFRVYSSYFSWATGDYEIVG